MNKSDSKEKQHQSSELEKDIIQLLHAFHNGRARAVTSKNLANRFGISNPLHIRLAIAQARIKGCPIASTNSNPKGYYIPANREEAIECLRHLKSRVKKICIAAAGVEKGLGVMYDLEQLKLDIPTN